MQQGKVMCPGRRIPAAMTHRPIAACHDLCSWKHSANRETAWRMPAPVPSCTSLPFRYHVTRGSDRSSPETSQTDRGVPPPTPPPSPVHPNQDNASPASSSPSSSPGTSQPQPQERPQQPAQPTVSPIDTAGEEVDRQLSGVWEDVKREMRKGVDPETAKLLDSISYEELTGSNAEHFFRKLAGAQLGPILALMGLDIDPYEFLMDMIKVATFLQFVTCGMAWFGGQSIGHMGPAEAATLTAGLAVGYLTRPAFKIELLLFPVYNSLIQLAVPNATLEVPPSTRDEVQSTLNRLGITLALGFLLPQLIWGWTGAESATFVAPLCVGWFMFDITYMAGLLLLLQRSDNS